MSIGNTFLQSAIKRVRYYKELGDKTIEQVSGAEMHFQPNPASNSIAVIIRHMSGNMLSRWTGFLDSDGEKEWRNRDTEFEEGRADKDELIALWEKGWACFLEALEGLKEEDLLKTIRIRSEELSAIDAINRQLAHYPYHVGQMIYLGKIIRNGDWKNLSIAKGDSAAFNREMEGRKG